MSLKSKSSNCDGTDRVLLRTWLGSAAAFVALVVVGCKPPAAMVGGDRPPPPVTVATTTSHDVPVYIHEIGKCAPVESVTIIPQVAGQVTQVHFIEGADLKKGDPLFTIDPRPYEAAVAQATAQLAKDQAAAENAAVFSDRQLKVFKQNSVSAADYDQARFAAEAAKATAEADKAALETAKLNLEYCHIKSPIEGRAGQRLVDPGNVTKANEGAMLMVQHMDPIYFDFTTSEKNLDVIRDNMSRGTLHARVGMPDESQVAANLEVTFPADSSSIREGKLTFLDNTVKDGAGTIKLRVELPNQDRHFWPGQFAHVWLVLNVKKDAVLMPSMAVQMGQAGEFVFVIKHQAEKRIAEQRPIKTGQQQSNGMIVVLEGLKAGETVITDGQSSVTPDKPVNIVASPAPTTAQSAQVQHDKNSGGEL